ncbi:MAG: GAF domain-containing protein [Oscillospiraceae bacterium]|nr:GAF domain-containing protein [Oscillospiraceae bacterium]
MYKTDYDLLNRQAESLIKDVPYLISNLANISALIYETLEDINWAGFYLAEGDKLYLGPFQGKTACVEIPFGRGVCGTAATENKTQLVADVHKFPGHIACDSASQSEIVVPVNHGGRVIGVLDIDSPVLGRFSGEDEAGLEELVHILERELNKS